MRALIEKAVERTKGKGEVRFVVVFPMEIRRDLEGELLGKSVVEEREIARREYRAVVACYGALGLGGLGHRCGLVWRWVRGIRVVG